MNIENLIKKLDVNLIVTNVEIIENTIYIHCERLKQETACKYCGEKSLNIHSLYDRTVSDLTIQEYKVKLVISVKKYICPNDECIHKTFAESFDFVEKYAIRTKRLDNCINDIGLKNSSVEAEKTIRKNHVEISNKTVLRIIKKKKK